MIDKIVGTKQMIPAKGWYALYQEEDGSIHKERLVCWVLVQREDRPQVIYEWVEGMSSTEHGIDYCENLWSFIGYCHESNLDKYPEVKEYTGVNI